MTQETKPVMTFNFTPEYSVLVLKSLIKQRTPMFEHPLIKGQLEGVRKILNIWDSAILGLEYAKSGTKKSDVLPMAKGAMVLAKFVVVEIAQVYAPKMLAIGLFLPKDPES